MRRTILVTPFFRPTGAPSVAVTMDIRLLDSNGAALDVAFEDGQGISGVDSIATNGDSFEFSLSTNDTISPKETRWKVEAKEGKTILGSWEFTLLSGTDPIYLHELVNNI